MGAGDGLELGQDVAHRLRVHAVTAGAAADRGERGGGRAVQAGGSQDGVEDRVEGRRIDGCEGVGVRAEKLSYQGP